MLWQTYQTLSLGLQSRKDVLRLSGVSNDAQNDNSSIYSYETLYAIYSQRYQADVAGLAKHWKNNKSLVLALYQSGKQLLDIAEQLNIAPCILVRRFLEQQNFGKQQISRLLRDPKEIQDARLRSEVISCIEQDEHYGPFADRSRQVQGLEYEYILYEKLHSLGIGFDSESKLRCQGFFKTPDVLLHIPLKVVGKQITWIDSKAKFGDEYYLRRDYNDSIASYVGRYGPGLVIYWFGYLEDLEVPILKDQSVILSDTFPIPTDQEELYKNAQFG